jgi:hypothetical protein
LNIQLVKFYFEVAYNVFGLGEGGGFTAELDTKHKLQIYEKLSYEALNRHFCQTRVMRSCYYTVVQFFNPIQSKVPIAIAVYVRGNF